MIERDITQIETLEFLVDEVLKLMQQHEPEGAIVLALNGDLGAGKTTFTQHLAAKLGVVEKVTSPTFMLMKSYELPGTDAFSFFDEREYKKLIHVDAYRIDEIDEMRVLGFEKLLQEKGSIVCIEWAEKVVDMLPKDTIHFAFSLEGERRSVTIEINEP